MCSFPPSSGTSKLRPEGGAPLPPFLLYGMAAVSRSKPQRLLTFFAARAEKGREDREKKQVRRRSPLFGVGEKGEERNECHLVMNHDCALSRNNTDEEKNGVKIPGWEKSGKGGRVMNVSTYIQKKVYFSKKTNTANISNIFLRESCFSAFLAVHDVVLGHLEDGVTAPLELNNNNSFFPHFPK